MEARKVTPADVPVVAAALARSFYDDPITSFLFPKESRRLKALQRFFTIEIKRMYLPYGAVYTTDAVNGGAIWGTPDKPLSQFRDLFSMIPMAPFVMAHPVRSMKVLGMLEAKHPKEPHYYLATLGVDPPAQGGGVGSLMMQPVLARCDEEGIPGYLESSKEKNVPLYQRYGFEVTEKIMLPLGGPPVWLMWREPKPPGSR